MNIDFLTRLPFAHRGLHNSAHSVPENSMMAFRLAVADGYPIELDIHLLRDGKIAVFHDDNLFRLCGTNVDIATLNSFQLSSYKLENTNEGIPLLEEVLHMVSGQVPLLIELKGTGKSKKLETSVSNILDTYNGEFAIQSFNPFCVAWFKRNRPHYLRGQLSGGFKGEKLNSVLIWLLQGLKLNFLSSPHFIAYEFVALPNSIVSSLRKRGKLILAWTITNKDQEKNVDRFSDNFIFEGFKPGENEN